MKNLQILVQVSPFKAAVSRSDMKLSGPSSTLSAGLPLLHPKQWRQPIQLDIKGSSDLCLAGLYLETWSSRNVSNFALVGIRHDEGGPHTACA